MTSPPDISAIMTAHTEGPLAAITLHSMLEAVARARGDGLDVEMLLLLDNPDPATTEALDDAGRLEVDVVEVSYADQGRVRNQATGMARGEYIAFLDGDDLWSENWLVEAHAMCRTDPGRVIAHPELDWIFDGASLRAFMPDQTDPWFDPGTMRLANPWDALCVAPARAYTDHPFSPRAVADGYAYEDWHWNLETVAAGYVHRVAPETIHFKRRRAGSQFMNARASGVITRPSPMHDYAWFGEWRRRLGEPRHDQ